MKAAYLGGQDLTSSQSFLEPECRVHRDYGAKVRSAR